MKPSIERIERNRSQIAVSSLRTMRFRGKMMLHQMEIRLKAANIEEMERETGGVIRTPIGSSPRVGFEMRILLDPGWDLGDPTD